MSFVDMCYLRKTKVWNEALHYERQKTHQVFSVALTPQLREIISRYNDPASPWVLPCMQRGMLSSANKQEDVNGDVPPASLYNFYCMALRYYLTLLKEISRRLGHRGSEYGRSHTAYQRRTGPHFGTHHAHLSGKSRQTDRGRSERKGYETVMGKINCPTDISLNSLCKANYV